MDILKWVALAALLPLFILLASIMFCVHFYDSINTSVRLS